LAESERVFHIVLDQIDAILKVIRSGR